MSGIFKSVKKVFRSVKKFVKKHWKKIAIAAAIYFGGAYLMSAAGGAGAAAGVATGTGPAYAGATLGTRIAGAFTHSGQIWRNAISAMVSGGSATASASAYSQAVVMGATNGLALSSQVVAGTNAVKTLSFMRNSMGITQFSAAHITEAANVGASAGQTYSHYLTTAGPEMATKMTTDLMNAKLRVISQQAGLPTAGIQPEIYQGLQPPTDQLAATEVGATDMSKFTQLPDSAVHLPETATDFQAASAAGTDAQFMNVSQTGTTQTGSSLVNQNVTVPTLAPEQVDYYKAITDLTKTQGDWMKNQAMYNKIALGVQAAGLLSSAVGGYQTQRAAEKIKRKKLPDKWKASGVPGIDWKGIQV